MMAGIGIFLAAALLADAFGLAGSHGVFNHETYREIYKVLSGLAAVAALFVAVGCIQRGLQESVARKTRIYYLILGGVLILCAAAVTARLGILVRATGRAPEDHFPIGVFLAGIIAGLVLFFLAKGRARLAGLLFAIFVPVVMILTFIGGLQVNYLSVTTARAERIHIALEKYRDEQGAYPGTLGALTPQYLPFVLGPLTGRGQVWCYQSTEAGYRLGYAYLQRYYDWGDGVMAFYEPYFTIVVPQTGGEPPQGAWICDDELQQLKVHYGL